MGGEIGRKTRNIVSLYFTFYGFFIAFDHTTDSLKTTLDDASKPQMELTFYRGPWHLHQTQNLAQKICSYVIIGSQMQT